MNFEEAEAKFRQLQARVQRGEPISRAEYEDQVSQLAVQDDNGVLWEINPRTGKWMYFDGAEWVAGAPPGHDSSLVVRRLQVRLQLSRRLLVRRQRPSHSRLRHRRPCAQELPAQARRNLCRRTSEPDKTRNHH